MGIYKRTDSPNWWIYVETTKRRYNSGIPIRGGSVQQEKDQQRQAEALYAREQSKSVLAQATGAAPERTLRPISWTKYSEWYATHHAAHQRGHLRAQSMLRQLDRHFARFASLSEITEKHIREWMTARSREVAASTVNRELDLLKSALHLAVGLHLTHSPASEVRRFRQVEREPAVVQHDDEAKLLKVACPADRAWLLMGIDTLLRLGNIVNLQWPQVRLDERVIVPLNAKVSKDTAYITDRLHDALLVLPKPAPDDEVQWVFPHFHRGRGETSAENAVKRAFARLCQLAGVRHGRAVNGITFHSLRHTGATRALQNGASIKTVMKLGGWRDERMVLRYVHVNEEDVRTAAEAIGKKPKPRKPLRLVQPKTGTQD